MCIWNAATEEAILVMVTRYIDRILTQSKDLVEHFAMLSCYTYAAHEFVRVFLQLFDNRSHFDSFRPRTEYRKYLLQ